MLPKEMRSIRPHRWHSPEAFIRTRKIPFRDKFNYRDITVTTVNDKQRQQRRVTTKKPLQKKKRSNVMDYINFDNII